LSYEAVSPVVERYVERTVREGGWVSRFRVTESVVRVIVTKVTTEFVSPEGLVLSSYSVNTRYVETEYVAERLTTFLGLTRVAGPQPQPAPSPTPAPVTPPRLPQPQPQPPGIQPPWQPQPQPRERARVYIPA